MGLPSKSAIAERPACSIPSPSSRRPRWPKPRARHSSSPSNSTHHAYPPATADHRTETAPRPTIPQSSPAPLSIAEPSRRPKWAPEPPRSNKNSRAYSSDPPIRPTQPEEMGLDSPVRGRRFVARRPWESSASVICLWLGNDPERVIMANRWGGICISVLVVGATSACESSNGGVSLAVSGPTQSQSEAPDTVEEAEGPSLSADALGGAESTPSVEPSRYPGVFLIAMLMETNAQVFLLQVLRVRTLRFGSP